MGEVHRKLLVVPSGKSKVRGTLKGKAHEAMGKTELSTGRRGKLHVHICPTTPMHSSAAPLCVQLSAVDSSCERSGRR